LSGIDLLTTVRSELEMDWFDRRIVEYVLMWAPFGRLPDEDVFPEFGMTGHQLWARFIKLTSGDGDHDDLDQALIVRARAVAPPAATPLSSPKTGA
jgi:hypothetical protein